MAVLPRGDTRRCPSRQLPRLGNCGQSRRGSTEAASSRPGSAVPCAHFWSRRKTARGWGRAYGGVQGDYINQPPMHRDNL